MPGAADEKRHADGFIQLMKLVADASEEDLWEKLETRPHNFSVIDAYLKDEFSLMVMIAFDEMCTCRAYAADRRFYAGLGSNQFLRWLREVTVDEAVHSMNAVNVIRARYSDRIREVGAILESLPSSVTSESCCRGTFVLDYFGDKYTNELLANCRTVIVKNVAVPLNTAGRE
ncbi:hypothetical protein [Bradyrhizobium sp. Ai1a-2]|uniref:hypothetical protein n=1 Tax=Bradyrhizobium sp. Ai1a-2 TaxID=196490 RepID=UPI001FCAB6AD|nr:hypothetical protein [Bradyrhizobium sp. Ai1a-2]